MNKVGIGDFNDYIQLFKQTMFTNATSRNQTNKINSKHFKNLKLVLFKSNNLKTCKITNCMNSSK